MIWIAMIWIITNIVWIYWMKKTYTILAVRIEDIRQRQSELKREDIKEVAPMVHQEEEVYYAQPVKPMKPYRTPKPPKSRKKSGYEMYDE